MSSTPTASTASASSALAADRAAGGGAVASSHYLATQAGARALARGGTAIDAAIAAAATLCVVYPNNVALGGDLVALVREPSGRIHFVNATGRAAAGRTLEELRERHGDVLPDRGIDTVTIPGGVRGWKSLAAIGARLSWAERLSDARAHAADGHPFGRSVANAILKDEAVLRQDAGCAATFFPGGVPIREGETFTQPELASTIDAIIAGGPDAFYTGEVAERWVAGLRALGSAITIEEVEACSSETLEAVSAEVFGHEVVTSPPNTQGFALLRVLRALEERGVADPLGADADALAELFAEANAVRAEQLADPDVGLSVEELLGHVPAARAAGAPVTVPRGDTVGLVAVDDEGWAVSLVQSAYWAFGAAVLEPSTGVLFQNRGTAFSLDPAHPAAYAGGRRPPHTLMPVLVTKGGELAFAQATMGGQAQAQIHTQLFLRLAAGASAVEATSAPRFTIGAQDDGDTAATLRVETDAPIAALRSLESTRFSRSLEPPRAENLGHSNVIRVTPHGLDAASDPRSDGSAVVVSAADAAWVLS